jgi:hypothetical protein
MKKMTEFTLWLEFENTAPSSDPSNDFANISVRLNDGRTYGINVWTFDFLKTAIEEDLKNGKSGLYQIPPDLFVKELSRDCIQKSIESLLVQGDIEELLNSSVFGISYLEPWWSTIEMDDNGKFLKDELIKEINPDHLLYNLNIDVIAKRQDNDDILVEMDNGTLALVHLTWSGKPESKNYPRVEYYSSKIDFWKRKLKNDIVEFNE